MWLRLGLLGGFLAVIAIWFLRRARRKRKQYLDVGSVSEAWLAEHRGKTSDH